MNQTWSVRKLHFSKHGIWLKAGHKTFGSKRGRPGFVFVFKLRFYYYYYCYYYYYYYYSSFRFTAKLKERYRVFPYLLYHNTCIASPIIIIPDQNVTLVTVDEPSLTHDHPRSIVYIMVHSCCCTFYGFGQYIMTCIHHYGIIQSIFTAPQIDCALSIHLVLPHAPNPW